MTELASSDILPVVTAPTSYDEIPYPGSPYAQTHPSNLATLGRLFGLKTVPVEACRVLELGCGDGQNLGMDLAESAVATGRRCATQLGLDNIELVQGDLLTFDCPPAAFDYVIAHGLYSWVPAPVQSKILELIKRALSPNGVAYVSYNALPGGHFRLILRELMCFHTLDRSLLGHEQPSSDHGLSDRPGRALGNGPGQTRGRRAHPR